MIKISTITASGRDAFDFLQGQLTNDLKRLESDPEILAAWCNPKGRVIWFGTVWLTESGYGMSAPAELAANIIQRLTAFRFRARVDLGVVNEGATVDPAALIADGHALIGPAQVEKFTPHMLNLDLLDAISFDKGCYTGQEIVARTHYKGATKRRTLRFLARNPVAAGDKITAEGRAVGEVLNAAANELLGVVPTEKAGANLDVGGVAIKPAAMAYEIPPG